MKREKYAWVTAAPAVWLLICTMTAGLQKVFHDSPAIGFLAQAKKFGTAVAEGKVIGPAKSMDQMNQIVFNAYVDATLAFGFVLVVLSILVYGFISVRKARQSDAPTALEVGGGEVHHA